MTQLLLDLQTQGHASFANFVPGPNAEALQALRDWPNWSGRQIYLWGPSGSGKSHLLQALAADARQRGFSVCHETGPALAPPASDADVTLIDPVEALDDHGQQALFHLYNVAREQERWLIVTGHQPPRTLAVRDDLRTRLGWGLVYALHPLSEHDIVAALQAHALDQGYQVPVDLMHYLLLHCPRDIRTLRGVLAHLAEQAMIAKRPLTPAFAKPRLEALLGTSSLPGV